MALVDHRVAILNKTRTRPTRCPACGGRGWRLDLDERCSHCNPCCEDHFPSEAMNRVERAEHVCPVCSWAANPEWLEYRLGDLHLDGHHTEATVAGCPYCEDNTMLALAVLVKKLLAIREEIPNIDKFMGWPDSWWEAHRWRCINGHVSTRVLKSEELERYACLACRAPLTLTFPEDVDGPLPSSPIDDDE